MLDTVGGSLERGGRAGDLVVVLALWAAVALKVIAAAVPLLAIYRLVGARWQRLVWGLAWIEAAVLVIYGLVLTIVGLMVQAGVIAASASADHRALAWHTYLWDPWFLVWGLLVTAALLRARHRERKATRPHDQGKRSLVAPAERSHPGICWAGASYPTVKIVGARHRPWGPTLESRASQPAGSMRDGADARLTTGLTCFARHSPKVNDGRRTPSRESRHRHSRPGPPVRLRAARRALLASEPAPPTPLRPVLRHRGLQRSVDDQTLAQLRC